VATVELTVENPFPRVEIELALGDGDDTLAPHDLAFHVGIGISSRYVWTHKVWAKTITVSVTPGTLLTEQVQLVVSVRDTMLRRL